MEFPEKEEMKSFMLYQGRWQLSAVVLSAPLTFVSSHVPVWAALFIVHVLGATIFYPVDEKIFDSADSD